MKNSEDLNQWRVYADNGYGFMLGIRPQYFIQKGLWNLVSLDSSFLAGFDKLFLSKCIYNHEQQRSVVVSLLELFLNENNPNHPDNTLKLKFILKRLSSIFKHQSYSAENEWRVFCFPISEYANTDLSIKHKTLFRPRRGAIIQYVEQEFTGGSTLQDPPLESVVLGSNVLNDQSEIGDFLMVRGVHCRRVWKSKLKLREL